MKKIYNYNKYMTENNLSTSSKNIAKELLKYGLQCSQKIDESFEKEYLKKNGQFQTTDEDIILCMVDLLFKNNRLKDMKILEPSVGTGNLIVGLVCRLFEKRVSSEELRIILNNIYMMDISSEMINFAEINIKSYISCLYKIPYELVNQWNFNFIQTDVSVKAGCDIKGIKETVSGVDIKEKLQNGEIVFDYVIGNPPYITLYGKRDVKKNEEVREYYISNYDFVPKSVKNGKFNITMFFFEQALQWLKENGELVFIVDISLFESAFANIRKYILTNSKIVKIIKGISGFKGVSSGQVIIQLKKVNSEEKTLSNNVEVVDVESNKEYSIPQINWLKEEECKFSIIDDKAMEMIKKIEKKSTSLVSKYPKKSLRTCTMMLDMEEQFTTFDKSNMRDELPVMPYYVGSKSLKNKFSSLNFEKYFIYNKSLQDEINDKLKLKLEAKGIKNKKRIGLGDLEVYKSPKLFIRQSAKEIIATYTDELSAANNSLYCLSLSNSSIETINDLKVTCSQLNSKLSTFYALSTRIIRTAKGKQPQIKVGDLKKIRVTYSSEVYDKLLKITNAIYTESVKIEEALKEIDEILYSYYGLSSLEINYIEEYIKNQ